MEKYLEINNRCFGCDNCRIICPEQSIFVDEDQYIVEKWSCTMCGLCMEVCPVDAIKITENPAYTD